MQDAHPGDHAPVQAFRWISSEVDDYEFAPADEASMANARRN
jgi:hypothetical protein